jgi:hypothetical protein
MTRKYFNDMADKLNKIKPSPPLYQDIMVWETDVREMAAFCAHQNPNFNKQRFLDACGYEG